jgi:hypothetical protein
MCVGTNNFTKITKLCDGAAVTVHCQETISCVHLHPRLDIIESSDLTSTTPLTSLVLI